VLRGVRLEGQAAVILRDRVADIIFGTLFLFGGFAAFCIAVMRRRPGMRILIWLGIWSAMYGARPLADSLAVLALLPHWFQVSLPYLDTVLMYLILVVALLAFLDLTTGAVRLFIQAMISMGLAIGLAGIGFFIFAGLKYKLILYNNLVATARSLS
jgi:hypothetical protein